ncbi:MAG: hypothetical protein N2037_09085, partial [Acidimicrobiales bacterium]|nr:hypothetical protein [Acidimicrobiales bacterium]
MTLARPRPPKLLIAGSLAVAAAFVVPFAFLVVRTAGLGVADVVATLRDDAAGPLGRSLLLATASAASAGVIGVGLAWLLTRSDLPGRRLWAAVAPVPLVIPSYVGAAALVAGLAPGGLIADALTALGID